MVLDRCVAYIQFQTSYTCQLHLWICRFGVVNERIEAMSTEWDELWSHVSVIPITEKWLQDLIEDWLGRINYEKGYKYFNEEKINQGIVATLAK